MLHLPRWRIWLVTLTAILSIFWAMPSLVPASVRDALPRFLPHKSINLGLDLQGGSYLMFGVDAKAIYQTRMETLADDIRTDFRALRRPGDTGETKVAIPFTISPVSADGLSLKVTVTDPAQVEAAKSRINALAVPVAGATQFVAGGDIALTTEGNVITASFTEEAQTAAVRRAVSQSIEVIRRRIDETGTKEPSITRQGVDRIVVQAAGENDPEQLKRLIGQTAKLTFQMVDDSVSVQEALGGRIPPGAELLEQPGNPAEPYVLVRSRSLVGGDQLTDSQPSFDQNSGQAVVSFRFNGKGARDFGRATAQNVQRRFAIVLDDKVISAPTIQEPILGGSGQISGNFTVESANELSTLLRAGALPAPLKVMEQRSVGASAGDAAIRAGALAAIIALCLVVGFMLLSYGFIFGGISILALFVNLLMIIGAMSIVGATLTLPGIAGLILTIGAAVDANVLLYERMREEEAAGRSCAMAIDSGFKRAIVTVLDANITALLTALILFVFGAGPVRGFAWTLSIGVVTSMFTAILLTQVLLSWWYWRNKPKKLPI